MVKNLLKQWEVMLESDIFCKGILEYTLVHF